LVVKNAQKRSRWRNCPHLPRLDAGEAIRLLQRRPAGEQHVLPVRPVHLPRGAERGMADTPAAALQAAQTPAPDRTLAPSHLG
jgi:hypothetical protein